MRSDLLCTFSVGRTLVWTFHTLSYWDILTGVCTELIMPPFYSRLQRERERRLCVQSLFLTTLRRAVISDISNCNLLNSSFPRLNTCIFKHQIFNNPGNSGRCTSVCMFQMTYSIWRSGLHLPSRVKTSHCKINKWMPNLCRPILINQLSHSFKFRSLFINGEENEIQ